jgi:hypothetical protein
LSRSKLNRIIKDQLELTKFSSGCMAHKLSLKVMNASFIEAHLKSYMMTIFLKKKQVNHQSVINFIMNEKKSQNIKIFIINIEKILAN